MGTTKKPAIPGSKLSASGAELGSVVRPYLDHVDPSSLCFVLDKALQLIEAPVADPVVHSPASAGFSYSLEVFHYDSVSSVKSGDYFFADVVVVPSHETSFSTTNLLEEARSGASAFGLKLGAQKTEPSLNLLNNRGIEESSITCGGNVFDAQIYAENFMRRAAILNSFCFFGESEQEESPPFFVQPEQALTNFPSEVFFIAFGNFYAELLPSNESSKSQNVAFEVGTSREIISDTSLLNNRLGFALFDHTASMLDTSYCELSRKLVSSSQFPINNMVEFDVVSNLVIPSNVYAELQRFGISSDSLNNLRSCNNFNLSNSAINHTKNIRTLVFIPSPGTCPVSSDMTLLRKGSIQKRENFAEMSSANYENYENFSTKQEGGQTQPS